MIKGFFKTFVLFGMMFASVEGFSDTMPLEKLYQEKLQPEYQALAQLKERAKQRKSAYIISAVLAVVLLFVFAYYFKLLGVIVAFIMIVAGFWTLKPTKEEAGGYERLFKSKILSAITENTAGYHYIPQKLDESTFVKSNIFAPAIKQFASWDMYAKEGVSFSYVHVIFDTKENASVERMARNIFDGYLIIIERENEDEGVLVSEALRDEVADMDLPMSSFFAKGERAGKRNGFDIYGKVSQEEIDKLSPLAHNKIAISFTKERIYIALYKKSNPLEVDIFKPFDLQKAREYAKASQEIAHIVHAVQ